MKPLYITTEHIALVLFIAFCTYFYIKSLILKTDNKSLFKQNDYLSDQLRLQISAKDRLTVLCDEKNTKITQLQTEVKQLEFVIKGHTDLELEYLAENDKLNRRVEELQLLAETLQARIWHKRKPTRKLSWETEEVFTIG